MPVEHALPPGLPPRGLSREQAARYVGIGAELFDSLVRDGTLPDGLKLRGRRVWDRAALDHAFDALSGLAEPGAPDPVSLGKAAAMEAVHGFNRAALR